MSFCPELARPLGAPTLIPAEGGKTWPVIGLSGWRAARCVWADRGDGFSASSSSSDEMLTTAAS